MNEKFIEKITNIQIKDDGSFLVDYDGYPYHITQNMTEEYEAIKEFIKLNPNSVTNYIEPEYKITVEEKIQLERYKRNQLLDEADILLLKYSEEVELGLIAANEKYRLDLLAYKQDLRDISKQQDFPENIVYPTLPKYEDYI